MVQAIMKLDDYSTRVLDVVKGKYGLKNRNDALNKFILEFGSEFVEVPINEDYLIELDKQSIEHMQKYPNRKMTLNEVDDLLGL
ncbi:MAG: DUF2683 family protein [Nanoarchaeales archaeon]|nr:DUF2683 family protein [Nanoarchaeales archaeon]